MVAASRRTRWIVLAATVLFVGLRATHAVLAVTRDDIYGSHRPRIIFSPDTTVYLKAAKGALLSRQFLEARGPFGYSLFLKLVGSNLRAAVLVQTALSIAAWVYLAEQVRRAFTSEVAAIVGFLGVLAIGLAPAFMAWDAAVLTECLSIALVCVVIALAVRLAVSATTATAVAFAIALALASVVRDVNAFFAAGVGVAAAVLLCVPRARAGQVKRLAAVAIVCLTSAAVALGLSGASNRSFYAVADSIVVHVGGQPDGVQWFIAHGMPNDGSLQLLRENYSLNQTQLFDDAPRLHAFHDWLMQHGSSTYYEYLATHPKWVLRQPLSQLTFLFAPYIDPIARFWGNEPDIVSQTIGHFGMPSLLVDGIWATLAALGLIVAIARRRLGAKDRRVAWTIVVIGALVVPHALAVYHGDALEVSRHAVTLAAQTRIAVWIATVLLLDRFVEWRRARTGGAGA
ncbi:MAG TPA: hypothetical protein VGO03_14360 [Acidimicrobiia bacterium]|jgi:hypothetical protein